MATSLPSVILPRNVFVDLYAATGITVGTKLLIQNIGSSKARLYESNVMPLPTIGYNIIEKDKFLGSASAPVGVWAMSTGSTILQVEAV